MSNIPAARAAQLLALMREPTRHVLVGGFPAKGEDYLYGNWFDFRWMPSIGPKTLETLRHRKEIESSGIYVFRLKEDFGDLWIE
jgi:hypothetical protein